jgi:hypothetical protein
MPSDVANTDNLPSPQPPAIERDYAPQFEYCTRLLETVWSLRAAGSELTSAYTYTQAAILGRGISTYKAAITLLHNGHPGQTWMLVRSLFEDLIAALWLASPDKREEALKSIFRQEEQIVLLTEKTIRKHQDRVGIEPHADPELEAMEAELATQFGAYGERSWFPGLHKAIEHVGRDWEARGGRPGELALYYDIYQRHANLHLHNTVLALRAVQKGSIRALRHFSYGQRDTVDEVEMMTAFSMTVFCFSSLAELVLEETTEHEQPFAALKPMSRSTFDELRPSLRRKIGRNDPCWCGSGDKLKNCHGS